MWYTGGDVPYEGLDFENSTIKDEVRSQAIILKGRTVVPRDCNNVPSKEKPPGSTTVRAAAQRSVIPTLHRCTRLDPERRPSVEGSWRRYCYCVWSARSERPPQRPARWTTPVVPTLPTPPRKRALPPASDQDRGRRQAFYFNQGVSVNPSTRYGPPPAIRTYRPYGVVPPYAPTAQLTPFSIYAARPTQLVTPLTHATNLRKYTATANIKPASIGDHKPLGHKPAHKTQVTKVPPKEVQRGQGFQPTAPPPAVSPANPLVTPATRVLLPVTPAILVKASNQPHPPKSYGPPPQPTGCPGNYKCMPLVFCAPCFHEIEDKPEFSCSMYGGSPGVCCPGQANRENLRQVFTEPTIRVPPLNFDKNIINEAARAGLWEVERRDRLERTLRQQDIEVTNTRIPEYGHLQFFKTSRLAMNLARDAVVNAGAGDFLLYKFHLTPLQAGYGLQQFSVRDTIIADTCPAPPPCGEKERFYRTIDGSCNNLQKTMWGQARTPFQRISPPQYSDGLMRPRVSQSGRPLPSARLVSISTVTDVDNPSSDLTLGVMQWGQFIDHDLAHTPIFRLANDSGIECCDRERRGLVASSFTHPACFPIDVPADDPFFGRFGRRCMNFVRSMIAPRTACNLGYAEQMNQITHFLDGSNIYGSSLGEEGELRLFRRGLLKVQEGHLLPPDFDAMECESVREGFPCFRAGDNRVNEQVDLAVIHTVWVRMHNRVALELGRLNPQWSDETIYQEARRIVVAMYQHIVYNEWLPLILGKEYMAENGLLPRRQGFSRDYDSGLNPALFNEFATAAFRFGHTLVQGMLQLVGKKGRHIKTLDLPEQFNNPRLVYTPGKLEQFLRGLSTQPAQKVDNFVSQALTNRLFETPEMPFGMDLVALNIQRGRDHAIAPYNTLRAACGLPRAKTFEDLLDVMPREVVRAFQQVYESVDDIDAFIAGISERNAPGSILGPTFRCIVGDQFTRLKRGDRFFYDLADMPTSFSEGQLNEIRKISWARVLCATSDIGYVQPLALRQPRGLNQRVRCDSPAIPEPELFLWRSSPK
ncbi:salivary peroxidase/catechol oxidase-like [Panulirus ornatus]|uniref:salivary peroxidase/catechol oxidase-like n=1 Tax=Panulirus ornatus TaxID=150431 RepID=UPI003A836228